MYGTPAGAQVHAGQWQQDALHEANSRRRHIVDSDFERELAAHDARAHQHRLVAVASIALTTLTALMLI